MTTSRRSSPRALPPPPPNTTHAPTRSSSLRHSLLPNSSPPAPSSPTRLSNPSPRRVGLAGTQLLPRATPDPSCAFCGGSEEANKIGRREDMVSCWECGSAGHPTCLDWEDMRIVRRVLGYCWMCSDCKRCELCDEKGEDDDMLLCDSCDRGWHRSCLTPPMTSVPRGKWTCPTCHASATFFAPIDSIPLPPKRIILHPPPAPRPEELERERRRKEKGKQRALEEEDEEEEEEEEWEEEEGSAEPEQRQTLKLTLRLGTPSDSSKRPRGRPRKDGSVRPAKEWVPRSWGHMAVREVDESSEEEEEDVDDDEPYGGILRAAEADVGDRKPDQDDKKRWDKARQGAELKAVETLAATRASSVAAPSPAPSDSLDSPARFHRPDTPSTHALPLLPPGGLASIPIANIKAIRFGEFEIETWYQAPFPEEYSRVADGRLWICEFCLKYMKGGFQAGRHRLKCKTRHPPGDEIYRDGKVSVFEVDGRKNKIYCQNLCLLAKMFLDHKTLYYDVEPFLFYVMTTADVTGAKFVGYFSKEKRSPTNNVSCIMTLPVRQRKGWGNLLIDFSYLLSKKEGRLGTPERPLSDLGLLSYRNYWTLILFQYLLVAPDPDLITFEEISAKTAMTPEDIHYVLSYRNMITDLSVPPPSSAPSPEAKTSASRGHNQWTVRKRANKVANATLAGSSSRQPHHDDPHASPAVLVPVTYRIQFDRPQVEALVEKNASKGYLELKPDQLQWSPFLVTRGYGLGVQVGSTAKDPVTEVQSVGALGGAEAGPSGEKHVANGVAEVEQAEVEAVAGSPELGIPMELTNGEDAQPPPPPTPDAVTPIPSPPLARVPSPPPAYVPSPPRRSHKRKPSPTDLDDEPEPRRPRRSSVALRSLSQGRAAESPRRLTRGAVASASTPNGSSPERRGTRGKMPVGGEVEGVGQTSLMEDIAAFLPGAEEGTSNEVVEANGIEAGTNGVGETGEVDAKEGEVKGGEKDVDAEVDVSYSAEGLVAQ